MGLRFRKSFKIAPGIKLNLNKKSAGVTLGGRNLHYTINSKGKRTMTTGLSGTGLSYTQSSGGCNSKGRINAKRTTTTNSYQNQSSVNTNYINYLNQTNNNPHPAKDNNKLLYWLIMLSLIIAPPGGIICMFYYKLPSESKRRKILASISCLWCVLLFAIALSIDTGEPKNTPQTVPVITIEETTAALSTTSNVNSTTSVIDISAEPGQNSPEAENTNAQSNLNVEADTITSIGSSDETVVQPDPGENNLSEKYNNDTEGSNLDSDVSPIANETESYITATTSSNIFTYVLNTSTKKFHRPTCKEVAKIKDINYEEYTGIYNDVISMGYNPCKKCNPR